MVGDGGLPAKAYWSAKRAGKASASKAKPARAGAVALGKLVAGCGGGGATPPDAGTGGGSGGGGGGGGGGGDGGNGGSSGNTVLLFMVIGHAFSSSGTNPYYLSEDAGQAIGSDLAAAGFDVRTHYFADAGATVGMYQGCSDFVHALQRARDEDVPLGAHVVIVGSSHGGVWAHGAVRHVPDVPVTCLVDLDSNSYGWELHSSEENLLLGGNPRDDYLLHVNAADAWEWFDLEDVVFPNVRYALDVRSGASVVPGGE